MQRRVRYFIPVYRDKWRLDLPRLHYSPRNRRGPRLARQCKRWPHFRDRLQRGANAATLATAAVATTTFTATSIADATVSFFPAAAASPVGVLRDRGVQLRSVGDIRIQRPGHVRVADRVGL